MRGHFITFEGGEGSGKTTQIHLLEHAFRDAGLGVTKTREPGGAPGTDRLRALLLEETAHGWDAKAETLLFYADRMEHISRVIEPSLSTGTHVLCDRFNDSTFVYQGVARGVETAWIEALDRLALGGFSSDLTVLLDIPPEIGLARARTRDGREIRFERLGTAFHIKVRQGFRARAEAAPGRYAVINAEQSPEAIHREIVQIVRARLGLELKEAA